DPARERRERRQVVDVLQYLAHRLEHDREARVPRRDLEQLRRALALLPERRSPARIAPWQQQRPRRALPEARGEQGGAAHLVRHEIAEFDRIEDEQIGGWGLRIRIGDA